MEREKLSRKWIFTEASTLDSWFNERIKEDIKYTCPPYAKNCNNICSKPSFHACRIKLICGLDVGKKKRKSRENMVKAYENETMMNCF